MKGFLDAQDQLDIRATRGRKDSNSSSVFKVSSSLPIGTARASRSGVGAKQPTRKPAQRANDSRTQGKLRTQRTVSAKKRSVVFGSFNIDTLVAVMALTGALFLINLWLACGLAAGFLLRSLHEV